MTWIINKKRDSFIGQCLKFLMIDDHYVEVKMFKKENNIYFAKVIQRYRIDGRPATALYKEIRFDLNLKKYIYTYDISPELGDPTFSCERVYTIPNT